MSWTIGAEEFAARVGAYNREGNTTRPVLRSIRTPAKDCEREYVMSALDRQALTRLVTNTIETTFTP
jgi:hypothetical protein